MQTRNLLISLALVGALAEHAEAAPAWCKTPGVERMLGARHKDALADDPRDALPALVELTCSNSPAITPDKRRELDAARARWSKELDLTEAEWAEVAQYATQSIAERSRVTIAQAHQRPYSAMSPLDQYAELANNMVDVHYAADALPLTEAGRFGYVIKCLDLRKPVEWAICQPDIDALDRKRVIAELRADKRGGADKTIVRVALHQATKRIAERKRAIAALADPAYPKLFALAADARATFGKRASKDMLAIALAMDDARVSGSNRAYEGCEAKTWDAFAKAIGAIPAKQFAGLKEPFVQSAMPVIANDPDAYLAAIALHACEERTPDVLIRQIGNALKRWPGFRGPRTAALTAIATADVQLDDRNARLEIPQTFRNWLTGDGSMSGGEAGVVAKVTPGDKPTLEFVAKSFKQRTCTKWKDNSKVVMFNSSGSPIYGYDCLAYANETVKATPPPRPVKARYATGIKRGSYVMVTEAVVGATMKDPGGTPTHVFGIAVK